MNTINLSSADEYLFAPNSRQEQLKAAGKKEYPVYKIISNSTLALLNTCPRKFQLEIEEKQLTLSSRGEKLESIDTCFGTAVGAAIQTLWLTHSIEFAQCTLLANWSIQLDDENSKTKKSLGSALFALDQYRLKYFEPMKFDGWEVASIPNSSGRLIPGIEPACAITLPDSYRYDMHVDLILFNKRTMRYMVVELKTSGANYFHPAMFSNSRQATGYALLLMTKFKLHVSNIDCMYLVYLTSKYEFNEIPKSVGRNEVIQFLNDIIVESNNINNYIRLQYFPMRGTSCMAFGRPCYHFDSCDMASHAKLTDKKFYPEPIDIEVDYTEVLKHFEINVEIE